MKKINLFYFLLAVSLLFISCKKKFTTPPPKDPPAVSGYITIDSIAKIYHAYYASTVVPVVPPSTVYKFNGDANLVCVVTADEVSGNLYKSVYLRDATGGIKMNLTYSGGLYIGDSVRINLNGVKLNSYGSQIQLDSVNLEKSVHKIATGVVVKPRKVTLTQLNTTNLAVNQLFYQGELVQLDSLEFDNGSKNVPFADAVGKASADLILFDPSGRTVDLRSSGYANFASSISPCGKGSIIAIAGQYNGSIQLTLRQLSDLSIASGTCPVSVKSFNDNSITSGGWTIQNVIGSVNWTTSKAGGAPTYYATISNYINSANQACETWLISPPFNLSNNVNPMLAFKNATNYTGPALAAMVSTNYNGGSPSAATWTPLTFTASTGGFNFVNSGNISLAAYKTNNVTIAFKYTGTSSTGATWELDDISILDY